MRINGLKADWLWSLALVTAQLEDKSSHTVNKIRIEARGGSPMLIATDTCMMSVVHHTEASIEGCDKPFTLVIGGELRKALQRLGKNGRPRGTVSIDRDGEGQPRVTVRKDDAIVRVIEGEDAAPLFPAHDRFPAWTRILPRAEYLTGSWQRLVDLKPTAVRAFNPEMLRKIPVFDDGAIFCQPVVSNGHYGGEDYHAVRTYIAREHGMEDRAFTLMMPMQMPVSFDRDLPACVREAEADDARARDEAAMAEQAEGR